MSDYVSRAFPLVVNAWQALEIEMDLDDPENGGDKEVEKPQQVSPWLTEASQTLRT